MKERKKLLRFHKHFLFVLLLLLFCRVCVSTFFLFFCLIDAFFLFYLYVLILYYIVIISHSYKHSCKPVTALYRFTLMLGNEDFIVISLFGKFLGNSHLWDPFTASR